MFQPIEDNQSRSRNERLLLQRVLKRRDRIRGTANTRNVSRLAMNSRISRGLILALLLRHSLAPKTCRLQALPAVASAIRANS